MNSPARWQPGPLDRSTTLSTNKTTKLLQSKWNPSKPNTSSCNIKQNFWLISMITPIALNLEYRDCFTLEKIKPTTSWSWIFLDLHLKIFSKNVIKDSILKRLWQWEDKFSQDCSSCIQENLYIGT